MVYVRLPTKQNIHDNGHNLGYRYLDVIAKLPYPTTVKGVRSFLGHVSFYRRFIQDFSKIARPMTHLLDKETPFVFSKDCIDAFETLKKKLTKASILVAPDWNLPFELMCDASNFVIGAVLGQRKTKHFQPIHYASKTMTKAQIHYTTTEKEMLSVVYAFENFRPYFVLSKSIVYTDHSALNYLLSKQDAKLRLIRWFFLLQEFDIIIRDKKGTENLAADHLSRLENPHKDVFENKDINENFPLETLGKISSGSTPWTLNITSGTIPTFFKYVRIKSFDGVCMTKKLLISSKLVMKDPLGAIMVTISPPRKDEMPQNVIQVCEIFDVWGIDFMDHSRLHERIGDHRKLQLNELRDQAYENSLIYKEKMKKIHDSKIKNRILNVGPFTITKVFPYGTTELSQPDGPTFKVNGHCVKHYFRGDIPQLVVSDLQTFLWTNECGDRVKEACTLLILVVCACDYL
nr:reverse transcriptase domain-containing protein [Tanacetum cinerariifolium]